MGLEKRFQLCTAGSALHRALFAYAHRAGCTGKTPALRKRLAFDQSGQERPAEGITGACGVDVYKRQLLPSVFADRVGNMVSLCLAAARTDNDLKPFEIRDFRQKERTATLIRIVSKLRFLFGGPEGIRTHDLSDANRTLSQLSYRPIFLPPKASPLTARFIIARCV